MIGMPYKILPTREFAKDFSNLSETEREMIRSKVEEASENPERYKRLHYELKGSFRLRVEKLRVIYSISKQKQEMYLEKIVFGHKY